ncbi:hypothetical protein FCM35_KLT15606 [Carex littledalei]|uniref:Uncharacterized protein n=1 Tax=Carex littledalei TaxID=544730 RepID=A0A833R7Y0_9POAL|nr:hypothetical protein FCM35_KLT15606 [Carex littledalei]
MDVVSSVAPVTSDCSARKRSAQVEEQVSDNDRERESNPVQSRCSGKDREGGEERYEVLEQALLEGNGKVETRRRKRR